EVGKGSTFHFAILVKPLGSRARPWLAPSAGNVVGRSLLVVDDNATNRRILLELATTWGMRVQVVGSGPEALERLAQGDRFDVAVIDLHMPGMDGTVLASEIRRLAGEGMPRVLLSSLGGREGVEDPSL